MCRSFAKVCLQHKEQRRGNDREDNGKASEAPSPVDLIVEIVGCLWPGECSDHVRRGCKSVRQASVLQLGRIGSNYIYTVRHAGEAESVEHLGVRVLVFVGVLDRLV